MNNDMDQLLEYHESPYSVRGAAALAVGLVSLAVFLVLSAMSMTHGGNTGMTEGAIGLTAFIAAFVGMLEGLSSFNELCASYTFSKVGTVLCGVMVAAWFLIFCVGMA